MVLDPADRALVFLDVDSGASLPHRIAVAAGATQVTFYAVMVAIGLTVGLLVRQRREYADTLRGQATEQAITGERLRIAREPNDSVAHALRRRFALGARPVGQGAPTDLR